MIIDNNAPIKIIGVESKSNDCIYKLFYEVEVFYKYNFIKRLFKGADGYSKIERFPIKQYYISESCSNSCEWFEVYTEQLCVYIRDYSNFTEFNKYKYKFKIFQDILDYEKSEDKRVKLARIEHFKKNNEQPHEIC